jgi:hypothetical protein
VRVALACLAQRLTPQVAAWGRRDRDVGLCGFGFLCEASLLLGWLRVSLTSIRLAASSKAVGRLRLSLIL